MSYLGEVLLASSWMETWDIRQTCTGQSPTKELFCPECQQHEAKISLV